MASAGVQQALNDGRRSHFLVVVYGFQGHLNPARALARRLAGSAADVTLSVKESGFGGRSPSPNVEEDSDGAISYVPHSDSFELGTVPRDADESARSRRECVESLSAVVRRLADAGRPVTCIVSVLSLPAADVAVAHGIPLAVYWIQPATALAAYYHYFHGYEQLVASRVANPAYQVSLPGLPPLRIRDFPSFLVDATGSEQSKNNIQWLRALLELVGREKPKVLANTSDVLEPAALEAMRRHLDVFAIGPMLPPRGGRQTGADDRLYMEWLDVRPARSVVYLSFGSLLRCTQRQAEEMLHGLRRCGRPFLWVVRKDGHFELAPANGGGEQEEQGVVVEWCDQQAVLAHPSVGCFVTHCGWNSTTEAASLGVPMVAVPSRSDQALVAHLVEDHWGVGIRAERGDDGVLAGEELVRCIELLMVDGDRATEVRERAEALRERVQESVVKTGLIESTPRSFVEAVQSDPRLDLQ